MVDVGKLISVENLLVKKVTGFVHTTTSATLILSHLFVAAHMTKIAPIYFLLPRALSLSLSLSHTHTFWVPETALSLLHFDFQKQLDQLVRHNSIRITWVHTHSVTFFFPVLPFRFDFFQPRTQPQKFRQIPKETNNQHGRRHVNPRIHCYISVYWYLAWNI